ncbi:PAS domain S-box protein [Pseudomonas sp. ABC1]|uniref:ATP-binding protein n=1 Tax=Pseudomonas sp. ABC1 TaxID=2748080 RepID=UPI0015C36B28|nr:ATP-binding protein [Pseudomonas sp. ABC1]QLF94059.1 PAS domain S-box protein [Pseudomonas sp. ABC1]
MAGEGVVHVEDAGRRSAPSFTRALVSSVAGLVTALGLILLVAMLWQGTASTEEAARQVIGETLHKTMGRLQILIRAAEMTVETTERIARTTPVSVETLRPTLENALAAFEQRPELSYLGVVLPGDGDYGTLERTAAGEVFLWLFPGARTEGAVVRTFILQGEGFVARDTYPTDGYDPRTRPFYQAALSGSTEGLWMPVYPWIIHSNSTGERWGFSYVKPLYDDAGGLLGVLDSDFDIAALNSFLRTLSSEYSTRLQIVELGAEPRSIGGPGVALKPLPLSPELAALASRASEGAFVDRMELDGEQRWVAARRMELKGGVSWLVVASRTAPFIEAPLRQQLYQVLGMGVALVLGLVLVSIRVTRRFGRPLVELGRRVGRIANNDPGPLATAGARVDGFRETQLLGDALDHMAVAVRQEAQVREQQLASLALKGALFDFTSAAIFSLDEQRRIIEWNRAAEQLFGLSRDEVLEQPVDALLRSPEGAADWAAILATTETGTFRFVGAQGAFDAELRLVTFTQDARTVRTFVLNDITEREQAQARLLAFNAELERRVVERTAELRAINQELESFCHAVSHDLRAPLRGIAGFSEILVNNYASSLDEKARNYLGRVQAATHRMGELIDDLLKLSRVSRDEMHRQRVNLSALAQDVIASLRESAPERQVEVTIEDDLYVEGDTRLLRVMLENLLGNAWKFTSKTPGARIAFVSMVDDNGLPVLVVRDNGAGFDMRYAGKLFGAFQRLHRDAEFPGTGIGLATVKRIINRHGGYIQAHAELGKGATFQFSLERPEP